MTYELNERESIMAESGIKNVSESFDDTERWRIIVEAKHALDFYNKEERQQFLASVEKWRGDVGRKCMERAIMAEWNARKDAA